MIKIFKSCVLRHDICYYSVGTGPWCTVKIIWQRSQSYEFMWFEWVKYRYEMAAFPNTACKQWSYLGPRIDVDLVMMVKILTANSKSYSSQLVAEQKAWKQFMYMVHCWLRYMSIPSTFRTWFSLILQSIIDKTMMIRIGKICSH